MNVKNALIFTLTLLSANISMGQIFPCVDEGHVQFQRAVFNPQVENSSFNYILQKCKNKVWIDFLSAAETIEMETKLLKSKPLMTGFKDFFGVEQKVISTTLQESAQANGFLYIKSATIDGMDKAQQKRAESYVNTFLKVINPKPVPTTTTKAAAQPKTKPIK